MSELLKNQKFGVEVEFTGITREMAANAVREVVGGTISGPRSDGFTTLYCLFSFSPHLLQNTRYTSSILSI